MSRLLGGLLGQELAVTQDTRLKRYQRLLHLNHFATLEALQEQYTERFIVMILLLVV